MLGLNAQDTVLMNIKQSSNRIMNFVRLKEDLHKVHTRGTARYDLVCDLSRDGFLFYPLKHKLAQNRSKGNGRKISNEFLVFIANS